MTDLSYDEVKRRVTEAYVKGYKDGRLAIQDDIYMEGYRAGKMESSNDNEAELAQKVKKILADGPVPSKTMDMKTKNWGLTKRGAERVKTLAGAKSVNIAMEWHWVLDG